MEELSFDTSNIYRYLWKGQRDVNWYADCQEVFEKLFGVEELELVCKLFAATSINTSLKSNVKLFRKAYSQLKSGSLFDGYLPVMEMQLERIRAGEELSGRKINNFAKAMSGDPDAVVVDIWLLRAFGRLPLLPDKADRTRAASKAEYDFIEKWCRAEARAVGAEARQVSSMIWAGVRTEVTGDKQTHYKEYLYTILNNLFNVI